MVPKNLGEKSHSGIPGSKAACAYPGRYRGLPRPSSALKPCHSPDGVGVVGPFGGVYWRLVKTFCLLCASLLPVHGVILSVLCAQFTLHSASVWVRGCISFWIAYSMLLFSVRSEYR